MMVLYSGTTCPFSQRCRLVLFEKGMDFEIKDVDLFKKPEDINGMNPYGQVPIAPLLWRLDHYGIDLPKSAAPLMKYAERIFSRPAYIEALTPSEKVMRR